jgi:hypothetical protein
LYLSNAFQDILDRLESASEQQRAVSLQNLLYVLHGACEVGTLNFQRVAETWTCVGVEDEAPSDSSVADVNHLQLAAAEAAGRLAYECGALPLLLQTLLMAREGFVLSCTGSPSSSADPSVCACVQRTSYAASHHTRADAAVAAPCDDRSVFPVVRQSRRQESGTRTRYDHRTRAGTPERPDLKSVRVQCNRWSTTTRCWWLCLT